MQQEESGILETSPGAIALLIVFFLVVTLGIEHGLHHLKNFLKRRNKHGLLAAVTNLANELMLLGVASLLLTAIAPAVTKICLPAKSQMRPWLSNVQGCACCLTRTEGVSHCFIEDRHCPADFKQQCGVHPGLHRPLSLSKHAKYVSPESTTSATPTPTETHPAATGKRLLQAAESPAGAAKAGQAPVPPEAASNSTTAAYSYDYSEPTCAGPFEETYEQCDYRPGYAPVVTDATLEQVHMLLFVMAVLHIILSVMVLVLSTFRLRHWAKINGDSSDDALALSALQHAAARLPAASKGLTQTQPDGSVTTSVRTDAVPSNGVAQTVASEPSVIVVSDEWAHRAAATGGLTVANWRGRSLEIQGPLGWLRECFINASRQLLLGLMSVVTQQEYSLLRATFYYSHDVHLLAGSAARPSVEGANNTAAAAVADGQVVLNSVHHTSMKDVELSCAVSDSKPQQQLGKQAVQQQQQQQQQDTIPDQCSSQAPGPEADAQQQQKQEGVTGSLTTTGEHASAPALPPAATAAKGAKIVEATPPVSHPHPHSAVVVSPTTAAGAGLYAPYLLESVERDGSNVVGLGLPMWLLVIAFVLLSGAIGWATWLLLIIAGALLLVINTSLIAALRHVTKGGVVRLHDHNSWWLRHSRPLLAAVKLMLFFLSFVISNAVYFAAFFGPDSCFFSRTGFQRNPVPWYAVMIIDLGLLLSLALVTLPLYAVLTHTLRADKKLIAELLQRQGEQHTAGSHHMKQASH